MISETANTQFKTQLVQTVNADESFTNQTP